MDRGANLVGYAWRGVLLLVYVVLRRGRWAEDGSIILEVV